MDAQEATLVSAIENVARQAFDPSEGDATREAGQKALNALVSRTPTPPLIAALNALIKPGRCPRWLRVPLMDLLTLMPQRPDGVRATLEFVFATHPSSSEGAGPGAKAPLKQGAQITMEALKMGSNLLAIAPAAVGAEKWYPGLAPQLLGLLDAREGRDLARVAAYVVGFGVLGRKQVGAPGTPGWKALAEPMLCAINPSLSSGRPDSDDSGDSEVIDLQKDKVLVKADELELALQRLNNLLDSHPNPGLAGRLLSPLLLPLWTLASWETGDEECKRRFCEPAKRLLQLFLKISGTVEKYGKILNNLLVNGENNWCFDMPHGSSSIAIIEPRIKADLPIDFNSEFNFDLELLGRKSAAFTALLRDTAPGLVISRIFLDLFSSTFPVVPSREQNSGSQQIRFVEQERDQGEGSDAVQHKLVNAQVLQDLLNTIPDKLIADAKGIVRLASRVLQEFCATEENVDAAAVALSLLNMVITAPTFQPSEFQEDALLTTIETSLQTISQMAHPDISQTAQNLLLFLHYQPDLDDSPVPSTQSPHLQDRRTHALALSYITQPDNPPPVRAEGLNLLSSLIKSASTILDIQGTLVLLSSLLAVAATDSDDYMAQLVMRLFELLSDRHPGSVANELVEHYVDLPEQASVDVRLRFGEAILQFVQRRGEALTSDIARKVCEPLLTVAGRRSKRPRTEKKQEREAKRQAQKHREAERAWGGEVPDLAAAEDGDEDGEDDGEERKISQTHRDEMARIVAGWHSKRGAEDIRMRASALSVLAAAVETNVAGVGATLVATAVELAVGVLSLETAPETGILRRAAVVLVVGFVTALAKARDRGTELGFGLTGTSRAELVRVLRYVESGDEDGVARGHARVGLECLEGWRLAELLPREGGGLGEGLGVVGVDLRRAALPRLGGEGARPRIEEVE